MPKKRTPDELIAEAKKKNKHDFDYSDTVYVNNTTKANFKCNICGYVVTRTPKDHLRGYGCPSCSGSKKITRDDFIHRCNIKYNNKYDYSKLKFPEDKGITGVRSTFICPIHGEFEQLLTVHLNTGGCRQCGYNSAKLSLEEFIKKSKEKHNNKYDYSKVKLDSSVDDVVIICPIHGEFTQQAGRHMRGQGCKKCANEQLVRDPDSVLKAMKEVHPEYDYSKFSYTKLSEKVTVICPLHGEFRIRPGNVINLKQGCPKCASSKGEKKIISILDKFNIRYDFEYSVNDEENNKHFRYDFYLKDLNAFIEYHGGQHEKSVKHFGGNERLRRIKESDKRKKELAFNMGVTLFSIWHNSDIEKEVYNILKKYYKYKVGNKLYKSSLDLLRGEHYPLNTNVREIHKYRW